MRRHLALLLFSIACGWGSVTYTVTAITPADVNGNLWLGGISGNGQFAVANTAVAGYLYDGGVLASAFTISGTSPRVRGVNDSGTTAGHYDSGGAYGNRALSISSAGDITFLTNPIQEDAPSWVAGIDNAGNVAGTVITAANPYGSGRAIVWRADGSFIDITSAFPGAAWAGTAAIAENGYVIGKHPGGGFLYNFLTGQSVSLPEEVVGVSDAGHVTGYAWYGTQVATLYSGGTSVYIGSTDPGYLSQGLAVNSSGTVVGQSATPGGNWRAFVYSGGVMSDLNTLLSSNLDALLGGSGWYLSSAAAINNAGMVLAKAVSGAPTMPGYAVLLTPVGGDTPEPATYLLLGAGLGWVISCGRREHRG